MMMAQQQPLPSDLLIRGHSLVVWKISQDLKERMMIAPASYYLWPCPQPGQFLTSRRIGRRVGRRRWATSSELKRR